MAYALSYRDVEELAQERDSAVDRSIINRWVVAYSPALAAQFQKQHKKPVHGSWRIDATYFKVKGQDVYLCRAVDKLGNIINSFLIKNRDKAAASRFLCQAIDSQGLLEKVTVDKRNANLAALI